MTGIASPRRVFTAALLTTALTAAVAVPATASTTVERTGHHVVSGYGESARLGHQKAVVVRVLKGVFEQGNTKVVDRYVRPDYIQHNPLAPDGPEALKNLARTFHERFPDAEYDVKRVIAEGDLVVVHSNVVTEPGTRGGAAVDIFRFQGGKIAEHWDTLQTAPETSVNGNDMFSTESRPRTEQPRHRWLTAYNKRLVTEYYDQLLVKRDLTAVDRYVGTEYHQHNPYIPDGVDGVRAGISGFFQQFPQLTVSTKRVIAEGDLVAVHSHYVRTPGDRGAAVIDLFRVRDGKIVEHWDVIQDVPATSATTTRCSEPHPGPGRTVSAPSARGTPSAGRFATSANRAPAYGRDVTRSSATPRQLLRIGTAFFRAVERNADRFADLGELPDLLRSECVEDRVSYGFDVTGCRVLQQGHALVGEDRQLAADSGGVLLAPHIAGVLEPADGVGQPAESDLQKACQLRHAESPLGRRGQVGEQGVVGEGDAGVPPEPPVEVVGQVGREVQVGAPGPALLGVQPAWRRRHAHSLATHRSSEICICPSGT